MNNLYIYNETFTNGYFEIILPIFSMAAILCGIFVIISKNPIISVLFLIGLFLSIASYLIILGINFIGLSYLLVYVGAVSILFLFILMLINVRISELLSETSKSIPLAILVAIVFNFTIFQVLPYGISLSDNSITNIYPEIKDIWVNDNSSGYYNVLSFFNNSGIFFVTSSSWDGNLAENSHIVSLGNIMYSSFSPWLILTSVILLLAMVGAIVITIKQTS